MRVTIKVCGGLGKLYCTGCTIIIRESNDYSVMKWDTIDNSTLPIRHNPKCQRAIDLTWEANKF